MEFKSVAGNRERQNLTSHGQRFELHPDGNSLDFFTGLVRRKLAR